MNGRRLLCDFRTAKLLGVDFSTATLEACQLAGATYDAACKFPKGFDPSAAKMVLRSGSAGDGKP